MRWLHTSTTALKLDRKGGTFVAVPGAAHSQAVTSRTANLTLDDDGTLHGELTVLYYGSEALERRLEALSTDDAGKKKMLEEMFGNRCLPALLQS